MKHKFLCFSRKRVLPLLICCAGVITQSAHAQSTATMISALNALRASIDSLVATAATYIFQTPFNVGNEVTINYAQNTAAQTITTNVATLNGQDIQNGLAPNVSNPNLNLTQLTNIQAVDSVLQTLTIGGVPIPFYSSAVQQNLQNAQIQGNQNFNYQSLMSPPDDVYSTQQLQSYALNFIHFISSYGTPVSNFNLNSYTQSQLSSSQKQDIQSSGNYQTYMLQRRQLLAQQSAILTNLYGIYQKRMPVTTITAGDTPLGVDNPSLAQIEDYTATWRTSSPTWYTQMATASQTNVEREILFVLAEIQTELHSMHRVNEHLLALTAIGQLGGLQSGKTTLAISEKQVIDTVNQQVKQNATQGSTNSSTPADSSTNVTKGQADKLKQSQEQVKAIQQQTGSTQSSGQNNQ